MTDWHLTFCKPNQEHIAQQNLLRQGFDVYLPQVTKKQVLKEQVVIKAKAMFPRYLFVKAHDERVSLAAIRSTIGAIGLVRFGIEPAVVNPSLIEHLKGVESASNQDGPAEIFKVGDSVEITDGPFMGLSVKVLKSVNERVKVLMKFMSQQYKINHVANVEFIKCYIKYIYFLVTFSSDLKKCVNWTI